MNVAYKLRFIMYDSGLHQNLSNVLFHICIININ